MINDGKLTMKTSVYEILDIEIIVPFDKINIQKDESMFLTKDILVDFEIESDIIEEKDKVYNVTWVTKESWANKLNDVRKLYNR